MLPWRGLDELVDPRPAPIAAKANRNVYGPFDTHWNGSGAYVAYRELMTRIARDFPDLQPFEQSHFTPSQPQITPKGLSLRWELPTSSRIDPSLRDDPDARRQPYDISERYTELIPLLKLHFRRIIVVHVQDGFCRKDLIERYRQDTIVVEVIRTSLGDE
jgi:alginate O-acetyltransferase complex protein AlgJ